MVVLSIDLHYDSLFALQEHVFGDFSNSSEVKQEAQSKTWKCIPGKAVSTANHAHLQERGIPWNVQRFHALQ